MPVVRVRWLLSGLFFLASLATASGHVVYKWKDSAGAVHLTDTPPPPGAMLLKGPKPAPGAEPKSESNTARDDKPMLGAPCRPDINAADCDAARRALQSDLENLEHAPQQAQASTKGDASEKPAKQNMATRASDCSMWRDVLASLEDRQSDKNPERLTASARAALPSQMADAKRRIADSCD